MSMAKPVSRVVVAGAIAVLAVPMAATSSPQGQGDVALTRSALIRLDAEVARKRALELPPIGARAQLRRLQLEPGDLLSATSVRNRALQVKAGGGRVLAAKLKGQDFIPRGVDYDPVSGLLAIAAVSQVLLYAPATGKASVVAGEFDFANDVVFDGAGGLVIVDQGAETNDEMPLDGAVWRYDLATAEIAQIATNKELSNPKLVARDKKGVIHFIDGGSGDLVSPVFDVRWDVLYRIEGKKLNRVKAVWDDAGIQATAYDIDRTGWHWIINVGELVRIRGTKFQQPCLPPYPLLFATGLTVDNNGDALVLDGADVLTKTRTIRAIDSNCEVTLRTARKLKGSRGLTHVPDE